MTLRPEKRRAIVVAARDVFAERGYGVANTAQIAAAAQVSTRTLYKHFPSKQELFRAVLVEGATVVADAFDVAVAVAVVPDDADAERCVSALAGALAAHRLENPAQFALSDQLGTYASVLPADLLDAWRRAGPERVERAVADRLARLGARGELAVPDPERAAYQLVLLIACAVAFHRRPGTRQAGRDVDDLVRSGVHTFLHGHVP